MTSRIENLFRIRSFLDSPYPQSPNLHRVLQQEIVEEQRVANELNNTGKAWTTAEYQLNFNPNQDTYTIHAEKFGKAIFVVKSTGDANIPFIPVPFTDVTELDYGTIWSDIDSLYGGLYGVNYTAERMAFYRTSAVDQEVKVKIQPMLRESATYTITYVIGAIGNDDPLGASTLLPEHSTMIQLRAAAALLPYSAWHEDEEKNARKKQELREAFGFQLRLDEQIFHEYIRSLNHPRQHDVLSWDE